MGQSYNARMAKHRKARMERDDARVAALFSPPSVDDVSAAIDLLVDQLVEEGMRLFAITGRMPTPVELARLNAIGLGDVALKALELSQMIHQELEGHEDWD
jgi:hypothetical protein